MNTIIVDDELNAIKMLKYHLTEYFIDFNILETFTNIESAFAFILKNNVEVLFLDINMPNGTGLDLLDKIQGQGIKTIFTTAHSEYAIDAIKGSAFDYLLKPIGLDDLNRIHQKLLNQDRVISNQTDTLTIKVSSKYHRFKTEDIIMVTSEGNYSTIHLSDGESMVISKNLKKMETDFFSELPFFRVHQSHIININHVKSYCIQEIIMSNNLKSLVSAKRYEVFLDLLK